jgi:hypothetical protein
MWNVRRKMTPQEWDLLEEHENSSKENPNGEPGCMNTIDYWIWLNNMTMVRVSSLFFHNPCIERQLSIVNRGYAIVTEQQWLEKNKLVLFNIIKEKLWIARQRYSHLRQRKAWLMTATRKRPEVNKPGNRQETRDPMDQTREVPIGATETIRTACKETLQSLVTTSTNIMELEIKVIGSPERQRQ